MSIKIRLPDAAIFLVVFALGFAFSHPEASACGWWGDGEDDDPDAIIVLPQGKSKADLAAADARRILKTSDDPALITKTATRLLALTSSPQTSELALKLLNKAARLGFAPAQNNLAVLFEQGKVVRQDFKQAASWFEKAAKQGEVHAQHSLGIMYYQGRGVPKDKLKASYWIERSARRGHAGACTDLKRLFGIELCTKK